MVTGASLFLLAASSGVAQALNAAALANQYFGSDASWYQNNIPFFESSDAKMQEVYYYRWKLFKAHQRDLGQRGFISTEFLDDVGWQLEPWASLNDATGFHIGEGRWLKDRRYADDYINHMFNGGDDRHFTDYIADSVYGRYLVDGDASVLTSHLDAMVNLYNQWNDAFDSSKGLYWREPLADATEYTISSIDASGGSDGFGGGQAFRPSINSYMWAQAVAISKIATLAGRNDVSSDFANRASTLKTTFQNSIWNTTLNHFIDRYQVTNRYVKYWDPIRGRELVGLVPWQFGMPDDTATFSNAWTHLTNTNELRGSNGMRTNEPSYQYYMRQYRYDGPTGLRECQWNGPVWPYQTTQVLLGMANLINNYKNKPLSASDYFYELGRYIQLHYLPSGVLDLVEDYEPDKAGPIVLLPRSHHYFHSGYIDVIISGLVGIRPRADDTLEVNPLVPANTLTYFQLDSVPYHGHLLTVTWDSTGSRYGFKGLQVSIDGKVVASSATMTRLTAPISRNAASAIYRPIAQSIQLVRGQNPLPSASSNTDGEALHDAVDGRVQFYTELTNGWESAAQSGNSNQWFQIDFGKTVNIVGAEVSIFSDGNTYFVPTSWAIQWSTDGNNFNEVGYRNNGQKGTLVGGTTLPVPLVGTQARYWRFAFAQPANKKIRLVEFKLF